MPLRTTSLCHSDAKDEHMFAYSMAQQHHKGPLSRFTVHLAALSSTSLVRVEGRSQCVTLEVPYDELVGSSISLLIQWNSSLQSRKPVHKACPSCYLFFASFPSHHYTWLYTFLCMSRREHSLYTITRPSRVYTPLSSHAHHRLAPPLRVRSLPTSFPTYPSHVLDNSYAQTQTPPPSRSPPQPFRRWLICSGARSRSQKGQWSPL